MAYLNVSQSVLLVYSFSSDFKRNFSATFSLRTSDRLTASWHNIIGLSIMLKLLEEQVEQQELGPNGDTNQKLPQVLMHCYRFNQIILVFARWSMAMLIVLAVIRSTAQCVAVIWFLSILDSVPRSAITVVYTLYTVYITVMYRQSHFHAAAGLSTFLRRRALLLSSADKRHKSQQTDHKTSCIRLNIGLPIRHRAVG